MTTQHEPVLRAVDAVRKIGGQYAHLVAAGRDEAARVELLMLAEQAEKLAKLCRPSRSVEVAR